MNAPTSIKPLYAVIASTLDARIRCAATGNVEWFQRHGERIDSLCREYLPHGSGIDGAHATLDIERSTPNRLIFAPADFHHMDEHGSYDGWTAHSVIVTPSLAFGIDVRVTGRDRNGIKEYLAELFQDALTQGVKS